MANLTEMSVYAQFPKNVTPNTEHDLDLANWEWRRFLVFPVTRLNELRLSLKPYKWIRYATGIVLGARGQLSRERDLPNPLSIDYDTPLSTVSMNLYYHTKKSAASSQLTPSLPTQGQ